MSAASLNCDKPGKVTPLTSGKAAGEVETETREELQLRKKAEALLSGSKKLQTDYFKLCSYIREKQMDPKTVRRVLLGVGFHKAQVSEFLRVSFVSEEIWLEYKSKAIGFKLALEAAREEKGSTKTHSPKTRLRNRLLAIAHKFEDAACFLEDGDIAVIVPEIEKRLQGGKPLEFKQGNALVTITTAT